MSSAVVSELSARALELPDLLALVGELASTDVGRARVQAIAPHDDLAALLAQRARFEESGRLLGERTLVGGFEDPLAPLVAALADGGRDLGGRDLVVLARLLRTVAEARDRILAGAAPGTPFPALAVLAAPLPDLRALVARIERALDRRGEVREDASPELVRLRGQIRRVRDELYGDLTSIVGRHQDVLEETIPMRGGRLVLLLDAGGRGRLQGLVHGRSGTGKSFYFEPLQVVETNNQLQQASEEELAERRRILAELLAAAHAELPGIAASADFLAELDALGAAWRFGELADGRLAELSLPPAAGGASELAARLVGARHPLLEPRLAELREQALGQAGHTGTIIPLDLTLDYGRRALVVTGPNAGGKTVVLKTLGLLTLANQCGLPVPAALGTRLPFVRRLVATVGDEQDLLADRSTFSGRLLRLKEAWEAATEGSALVLLDELGSGTDPEEGAALAIALLEALLAPPTTGGAAHNLALITTHLTQLAAAALDLPGASCAAMEFLPASGRPSFRLLPGPPGGSEALALGRRLGLPAAWLDRAEALLGTEHRQLRRLLGELEAARQAVAATQDELDVVKSDAEKLRDRLDRERAALEAERRVVGRRLEAELEAFRRDVSGKLRGEIERLRAEQEQGRRKSAADGAVGRLFAAAPVLAFEPPPPSGPLVVGAPVRHRRLAWTGVLERLDGDRAEVAVRGKRVRCGADELEAAAGAGPSAAAGESERARPAGMRAVKPGRDLDSAVETAAELNLIGWRVEAALEALDNYLDLALRSSRRELRVVHGHGSGRLREAVREHLRRHPGVATQRPGGDGEGGNGATVVQLREL
jgi:DNA mismatch repair protein MutS2